MAYYSSSVLCVPCLEFFFLLLCGWGLLLVYFRLSHMLCRCTGGCLELGWCPIPLLGDMSRDGGLEPWKPMIPWWSSRFELRKKPTSELPPLSTLEVEPLLDNDLGALVVNCRAGEWFNGLTTVENVSSTHRRYLITSSVTLIILPKTDDLVFIFKGLTAFVRTA